MGTISGEELVQWEKMQGGMGSLEEKILVLVRLRPLSEKEIARNEVSDWECINNTTILYRNSLQERSGFPTAYTYDRVFRGDNSTKEVYEEGTKEIALSVLTGINSTIFAYGQTSSGKTYTMVGITEYTVADIYDYIHKHEERAFVLKFSAIEIYNEAIRDLLSTDNIPLRLLDDPEKGTIVEKLTEITLRDRSHLKDLLSVCEALRRTGETSLNETSSRSHQILRLTIESSSREFLGKDKSATLSASVNFVDLAGSERASQALSAGTRLKEGCHINRSLLTLGTVIRKLSKGRNGHINYRDSKLTRILQPSLGGNARTAIVCTLSPAQSHVEQSRNTLLFASCAKEVTTNAKVNVVMSDKALVKHLQKELARLESELRTPALTSSTSDYTALLKKKDLQIEKMEKEIKELTKQRDLAESRIEDLLRMVGNNETSGQLEEDNWEDDIESPARPYQNAKEYSNRDRKSYSKRSNNNLLSKNEEADGDLCKEVQCIETDENDCNPRSSASLIDDDEEQLDLALSRNPSDRNLESRGAGRGSVRNISNGHSYGMLERKMLDVQNTIDSLVRDTPNEASLESPGTNIWDPSALKSAKSWSRRTNLKAGSSSPSFASTEQDESTPPNGFLKDFPGRPDGLRKKLPVLDYDADAASLSRNDSVSSMGSTFIDELAKTSEVEDITSIQTFVAGLKEAQVQYEKQLVDGQGMGTGDALVAKNEGLDLLQDAVYWPQKFERQQRSILDLWESCNVSLIHRTYFFLLFKGDPTDSIYMEVELRRLTFLKQTFSQGNQAVEDGRTLTLASSLKTLRREREMLSKLVQKRFTVEQRNRLYQKWGIALNSKRRRLQLVNRLWSDINDFDHVSDSASIVAKLVRFSEQGQALKEMFGLSFATVPQPRRRSLGWQRSMVSLRL